MTAKYAVAKTKRTNPVFGLVALVLVSLIGGYYVYASSATSDLRPLLIDRDGRDNHAGVRVLACRDARVSGDKVRVRVEVTRPDKPKYNVKALRSNVRYGRTNSRFVSGWTSNSQTYFVVADGQDQLEVNVRFANDYQETYPYIRHSDGRIAPVRAQQLDLCS